MHSTPTVTLPGLVAGRDLADRFADRLHGIAGAEVVVDARNLISGTSSFAAQLVHRIVVDDDAASLILLGAPASFARYARDAAVKLGVSDRLDTRDTTALESVGG